MAENENDIGAPKLTNMDASDAQSGVTDGQIHVKLDEESFTRPGAQLADRQSFTNRNGDEVICYPVIVDFRRLLQLTDDASKIRPQEFGIIAGVKILSSF